MDDQRTRAMMFAALETGNIENAELRSPREDMQTTVMPATTTWTADMVRALPEEGKRYE
jgi:hypothetical protein